MIASYAEFFVGQVVKVVVHTSRASEHDLYRQFGRVVSLGYSHINVEFRPGRVYVMRPELLKDAGSAS